MDTNTQFPRTLIPPACYPTVDTICKDLKLCSRRIRHALDSHADEFQLLQRIYYKNKNQHRVALFWRRVVEMRRYSERLNNSNIFSTLEQVRVLFFAPEATQNPKLLKGSWTHTPIKKVVTDAINNIHRCEALLQKMQERSLDAYRSFTLAMQTGAFVQLLLLLVAIVSRLRILSIEIKEALSMACTSLNDFLLLDIAPLSHQAEVSSDATLLALPGIATSPSIGNDACGREADTHSSAPSDRVNDNPPIARQPIPRLVVQRRPGQPPDVMGEKGSGSGQVKRVKGLKKKGDEIDHIFSILQ